MRRSTLRFSPRSNWMNDPNGLFHLDGTWHMFFQYNPASDSWGNMSWGHATSTDLLTWREEPVALLHGPGFQVFSGSAVVDHENTSGLGRNGRAPIVALYTRAEDSGRQSQWLAVSRDGGTTWSFEGPGPVIDRGTDSFRDPKILRFTDDTGRRRWVLVAVEAEDRAVLVYTSPDLIHWEHASTFTGVGPDGGVWECPDLFPLPVEGDPDAATRWVLLLSVNPIYDDPDHEGSHMVYFVGSFDGAEFVPDDPELWERVDHGPDCYAGHTFDNAPDGDRIMVAWSGNWIYSHDLPSTGWRGVMTVPRRLSLRDVDGTLRLVQRPAVPVAPTQRSGFPPVFPSGSDGSVVIATDDPQQYLLHSTTIGEESISFTRPDPLGQASHFHQEAHVDRMGRSGALRVDTHVDGDLLEVFADDGLISYTALLPLDAGEHRVITSAGATTSTYAID